MLAASPLPRTTIVTCWAYFARWTAACPAEFPGADHEHVLAGHGGALGDSAAVEHARTDQRLEAGNAEPLITGSRGEDDGTRGELFPVGEPEPHLIRPDL